MFRKGYNYFICRKCKKLHRCRGCYETEKDYCWCDECGEKLGLCDCGTEEVNFPELKVLIKLRGRDELSIDRNS